MKISFLFLIFVLFGTLLIDAFSLKQSRDPLSNQSSKPQSLKPPVLKRPPPTKNLTSKDPTAGPTKA